MARRFYILWLVAATLGAVGAAADIAWHFSRLFDEFSPPHNIATVGFIMNLGLLFWALVVRRRDVVGPERSALLLTACMVAVYLIAIPLDLTWHVIFGIDITTWSPTHLLLFYSSWLGQVAMMLAWLASPTARARGGWAITFAIGVLQLASGLFPLGQQEYGAVALDSLTRTGRAPWYVAPDMWALAGTQAERLARGGAPNWLYLVLTSALGGLCLTLGASLIRSYGWSPTQRTARSFSQWAVPGAATALVGAFLLFRMVMRTIFAAVHLPVAVVPSWLLAIGIVVAGSLFLAPRLATRTLPEWMPFPLWATARTRQTTIVAALGGMLGSLALYATMETLRAAHAIVPAAPLAALPVAVLAGGAGSAAGALLAARMLQIAATTPSPTADVLAPLAPPASFAPPAPFAPQAHRYALRNWRSWAVASLPGHKPASAPTPGTTAK
ncbi:MAG: hypothetical protein PVSMB4_12110 [Ktedonobacterales bacterium]